MPMSVSMLEAPGHSWHYCCAVLGSDVPLANPARLQVGLALEMVPGLEGAERSAQKPRQSAKS